MECDWIQRTYIWNRKKPKGRTWEGFFNDNLISSHVLNFTFAQNTPTFKSDYTSASSVWNGLGMQSESQSLPVDLLLTIILSNIQAGNPMHHGFFPPDASKYRCFRISHSPTANLELPGFTIHQTLLVFYPLPASQAAI